MINKVETGKRIAFLRNKLGYSQAAFAEKLGVSPQAVSKWETGQTLPDVDILLIISWMCRVTINNILDSEEVFIDQFNIIERELLRMNKFLICPECGKSLTLSIQTGSALPYFECDNHHRFNVEDGVIFFNTREIPGELWSLWLRNYEHYLQTATSPEILRYSEGALNCKEIMWREIEKLRPNTIVDIACGTGNGINIVANRHSGVRSALCWNKEIAQLARQHNNANVIAFPSRFISKDDAVNILSVFFATDFEAGRHQRRLDKIDN